MVLSEHPPEAWFRHYRMAIVLESRLCTGCESPLLVHWSVMMHEVAQLCHNYYTFEFDLSALLKVLTVVPDFNCWCAVDTATENDRIWATRHASRTRCPIRHRHHPRHTSSVPTYRLSARSTYPTTTGSIPATRRERLLSPLRERFAQSPNGKRTKRAF